MPHFPPMRQDPYRRQPLPPGHLGTSGSWSINDPSPSLNDAILGPVEEKDRTRTAGKAAIAQAAIIAQTMVAAARLAHNEEELTTAGKHRRANELSAKAVLPFVSTMEAAMATYTKEITRLGEKLNGPTIEISEQRLTEAASKLSGLPQHQRFAAVKKNIDAGSDLLVAVILRGDPYLDGWAFVGSGKSSDGGSLAQKPFPGRSRKAPSSRIRYGGDQQHIQNFADVPGNDGKPCNCRGHT
jgi:hypothetical protein